MEINGSYSDLYKSFSFVCFSYKYVIGLLKKDLLVRDSLPLPIQLKAEDVSRITDSVYL